MPTIRKRRAEAEASPSPPAVRQRRGSTDVSEADTDADSDNDYAGELSGGIHDQMVKKLVRLALASEYTRQPLRRADISAKVLAPNSARAFKVVFEAAQEHLERVFGMAMTELPSKEKVTIAQKRAAQKASGNSQGNQSSSKAYVLTSTLPSVFRNPIILHPPRMPTTGAESGYIGLYSFIVSVIYLSEGSRISEGKLERYLKRCNADTYVMNGEKTENVLKKMEKHGYIVKIKDREPGGEEIVDWVVGPRGKVEVGEKGVASMVRNVYGKRDVEMDQLEDKLEKSLGAGTFRRKTRKHGEEEEREGEGGEGAHNGEHNPRTATQATPQTRSGTSQGRTRNTRDKAAKQPQPRRSSRRTSGFVDDEAEGEDGEADEPDEAENYEEGDEDEGEDEGYY